jgi:hypothetical protein
MAQETEAFEVIVGTSVVDNANSAVVEATKRMADVHEFMSGDVFDVNVYGLVGDQHIGVGLCFDTDIQMGDDDGLKDFMDTCIDIDMIESVERVHYEQL